MSKEKKNESGKNIDELFAFLDENMDDKMICMLLQMPNNPTMEIYTDLILLGVNCLGVCPDCRKEIVSYVTKRIDDYKKIENEPKT